MRTWVDTDEICENTRNIVKMLSTSEVDKFSDVSEKYYYWRSVSMRKNMNAVGSQI